MSAGKLPEGWQTSSIGDLCKKVTDGSHNPPKASETGLPMLSAKNINNGSIIFSETHRIISEDEFWEENNRTNIESGDVLLTIVGTLGRTALVPQDFTPFTLQRSVAVLSTSELEPSYFRYALENRDFQIQIHENSKGTAQKGIYLNALKKLTINIAPKDEQKIIAEKLDTLLAQVDSTKARLEQIPQILKRFRQAVLGAATSGKLTEEWRGNNKSVHSLFLEYDNLKKFRYSELPDIPKGWKWLRFDQVAKVASNLKSPLDYPDSIHVAPNHIESWVGRVSGYQTVLADGVTSAKHEFYEGQILYSKIRPYLCKVAIAKFGGLCSADMYPINSKIDTHFLFNWMLTTTFTNWASNAESRTVLPKINQKDLSEIPVPTPPNIEQQEIVRRVEQLFAYADTIEKQVNAALAHVNNLTQSILGKAFHGELTAQWRADNPELISGENSAAALLEKIRAERAASGVKKPSRKKS